MTGLFWNRRDGRTLVWAVNGMPEKDRPAARNSALTAPEEALLALALGHRKRAGDRSPALRSHTAI